MTTNRVAIPAPVRAAIKQKFADLQGRITALESQLATAEKKHQEEMHAYEEQVATELEALLAEVDAELNKASAP